MTILPFPPPAKPAHEGSIERAALAGAIATLRHLAQHRKEAGFLMFAEAAEIERQADNLQSVLDGLVPEKSGQ